MTNDTNLMLTYLFELNKSPRKEPFINPIPQVRQPRLRRATEPSHTANLTGWSPVAIPVLRCSGAPDACILVQLIRVKIRRKKPKKKKKHTFLNPLPEGT